MLPSVILAIEDDSNRAFMSNLFFMYARLMYKVAMEIVLDHHAAEDMVQESFVVIIRHLDTVRKINSCKLQSYIVSIVRNTSINYVTKCNRQSRFSFLAEDEAAFDLIAGHDAIDEAIIRESEIETLRQALRRLPENERSILRMKYFDKLSDAEIATILNVKADSVRTYYTRSRRHLKWILAEDEKDESRKRR